MVVVLSAKIETSILMELDIVFIERFNMSYTFERIIRMNKLFHQKKAPRRKISLGQSPLFGNCNYLYAFTRSSAITPFQFNPYAKSYELPSESIYGCISLGTSSN